MVELQPGDVLCYSAGSTQTDPMGFRKVKPRADMMAAVAKRWPDLIQALGARPVLFINAYPASIGTLSNAVTVDTYLSPRIFTRALQLGRVTDHSVIVAAQPLFVAEALLRHISAGRPLPATLLLWVGGYTMPKGLEDMIADSVEPHVDHFEVVQFFGAAEVDSGCLMARDRNSEGELIYHSRDDVKIEVEGDHLLLALRNSDGNSVAEPFRTGDSARSVQGPTGPGWLIWNESRLHPEIKSALGSWGHDEWRRRTGYVKRDGKKLWIQLRSGESPKSLKTGELEYHDFAKRFGFSWLDKPDWK